MRGGTWLRRIDAAVLDREANVRVRVLVAASAAAFGLVLGLLSVVVGVVSLGYGYVPGVLVAAVLFVFAVLLGVAGAVVLLRSRRERGDSMSG